MNKNQQNWFTEIDYLRAIAIIAVLIIHTTDDTAAVKQLTGLTFSLIYIEELARFAVPMFVFVSGFVLYNKYKLELPMKEFYKKRFIVILIPYLIFSVIYYMVNSHLGLLPPITFNLLITSIFNFNAAGHFWYIHMILTFYIFYPAIIAYYEIIREILGNYTFPALFLSVLIMYYLGSFIPSFGFALGMPFKYLIYFLFGIYTNDNYEQICQSLEKWSSKEVILSSVLIISLPFFSMFLCVDPRCNTHFSQPIPYYYQLALISTHILHICVFMLCLYLILQFKPRVPLLQKIGEYSYGIFLVHGIFHNILVVDIFPKYSILPVSVTYYIILYVVMIAASYYTVRLMLNNSLTAYIITGKLHSH